MHHHKCRTVQKKYLNYTLVLLILAGVSPALINLSTCLNEVMIRYAMALGWVSEKN